MKLLNFKTLNVRKASQKSDIPTKTIKFNADFFGNFICKNFNYCLKNGDVISVNKETKSDTANYRLVSILPNLLNLGSLKTVHAVCASYIYCSHRI